MLFKREKSSLKTNTVYEGTIYSITVLNEDTEKERVLINVSCEAGQPSPASFATGTKDGARILNQLLDNLDINNLVDLKGKKVRFAIKENEAFVNTVIYGKPATGITGQELPLEEGDLLL